MRIKLELIKCGRSELLCSQFGRVLLKVAETDLFSTWVWKELNTRIARTKAKTQIECHIQQVFFAKLSLLNMEEGYCCRNQFTTCQEYVVILARHLKM